MPHPDVIVVGGGVIGCSVAYFLAREGRSVTLFERDDLASQASGAAAGMLAPICESEGEGPFFDFATRSLEMFPALAGELREQSGIDPQYVPSGVLRAATSDADAARLQAQGERLPGFGLEWLPAEEARRREPRLGPELRGALWSPREGHIYSPFLARAYAQAAVRLGARVERTSPVQGIFRVGDRATGVLTAQGEQPAGAVVLCAGVWTRFCAEWLGQELPLEPVRGQILSLSAPEPPLASIVWDEHVYLVPKQNGTIIAGATVERAGFDCRTTAAGVSALLSAATNLVPALAESAFLQAWAGLRPDTPDHLPVIGPAPGIQGVLIAAGHYRNGVLLSPATGRLVADIITGRPLPPFAGAFRAERLIDQKAPSNA